MSLDRTALAAAVARHGRVARVVVAEATGSAPREPGAAMLVWDRAVAGGQDGSQSGTIGGGALEHAATEAARRALAAGATGGAWISRHPLGPALGQCCGGAVCLVTEVWDAARLAAVPAAGPALRRVDGPAEAPLALRRLARAARGTGARHGPVLQGGWLLEDVSQPGRDLWIWGAGHVGRALVAVLAPLPDLAITWIDTAPERFPERVPDGVACLPAARPAALIPHAPADAEHLIVTYSHALDLELCHRLLGHGFAGAGLIGSATKWARFRRRLADLGHRPHDIARIACPIGDPSLGKAPQAIAIGVAATLLRPAAADAAARTGQSQKDRRA